MFNAIKYTAFAAIMALSAPAQALELDAMTEAEKDLFGQKVREYLLENPVVILEAYRIFEERQRLAELQQESIVISENLEEIQNDGFSWEDGNPDGDIVLVEFMDYKCGFCRKAHDELAALVKSDGNIRLVVKEYPILGQDSLNLSRAAVATLQSYGPVAYKKIYNLFIKHEGPVTDESIAFLANKIDLDGDVILAKMKDPSVDDHIRKTAQLGGKINVRGTPTFVINDQIVRGYVPAEEMKQILAELRTQSQ